MSYARFGWDDSDVYVYLDVNGSLCCCACALNWQGDDGVFPASRYLDTTASMVAHLREHEAAGHEVPGDTFSDLEADAVENDAWMAEKREGREARK